MSDFVQKVKLFNGIAGTKEEFNVKNVSLYMGLVLEEAGEMLAALGITNDDEILDLLERMDTVSYLFKHSKYDLECIDRKEFLDGAVDVAVVALGAGISNGSDIVGACNEVANSNLSKFDFINGEYVVLKDENGKIMKPTTFKRPELGQYLR